MPHTMRGARSRHSHPLPPVPAALRPTPCETPASRGERSLLCLSALVFFFLLFSDLGISRRGQGREGRNKKIRTTSQRSIPNPTCLACQHPPTHRVLWGADQGSQPLRQRSHPNLPCPASPPSLCFSPPGNWFSKVQQAQVQPRKTFGAARHPTGRMDHPETTPRGFCGILG